MKTDVPDVILTAFTFFFILAIASPGFIALFTAWLFYFSARRLTTSSGRPIASITHEGRVNVRGKAKPPGRGMVSPFFWNHCVWYKSRIYEERVEELTDSDADSYLIHVWKPIRTEVFSGYFYLVDPTGSVRVSPKEAKMVVENRTNIETDRSLQGIRSLREYLLRNDVRLPRNHSDHQRYLKFEEEWIPSGDDVLVIGDAVRGPTEYNPSQVPFTIKNIGKGLTITDVDYGKLPERSKKNIKFALFVAGVFFGVSLAILMIAALI